MDEATKARYKAFGEETRKMALDLAGGDEKKLGQAFRNGMANPATQDLFKRGRALGEAMRAAQTDAERTARAMFNIAFFDRDADVTYDAADFITADGTIYSIDPSKGA
jgi:hypothetical protein